MTNSEHLSDDAVANDGSDGRSAEATAWNADPLTNYPVGPDDAGNGVMVGIGFLVSGWRWAKRRLRGRPGTGAT